MTKDLTGCAHIPRCQDSGSHVDHMRAGWLSGDRNRFSNHQSPLMERLSTDPGIDPFLRRDTLVELFHLRRKLAEAESAEVDFKAEIERLRAHASGYRGAIELLRSQLYCEHMWTGEDDKLEKTAQPCKFCGLPYRKITRPAQRQEGRTSP